MARPYKPIRCDSWDDAKRKAKVVGLALYVEVQAPGSIGRGAIGWVYPDGELSNLSPRLRRLKRSLEKKSGDWPQGGSDATDIDDA